MAVDMALALKASLDDAIASSTSPQPQQQRQKAPEFRDKGICGLKKPLFFMENGVIDV